MKKIFYLIAVVIMLNSCDSNDPEITKIFGTISIENSAMWGDWIDSGEMQITIFPQFSLDPPSGWGEIPDNFFGPGAPGGVFALGAPYNSQNPIVLNYEVGKSEYEYEIELEPGDYSALALGFRHNFITDPSRKSATLGVHWGEKEEVSHGITIKVPGQGGVMIPIFDYPSPKGFTISENQAMEINFKADFAFVDVWF